jgi:hypothetical protein
MEYDAYYLEEVLTLCELNVGSLSFITEPNSILYP